ncbi:ComEA family DNA-binding protein [Agaribacter flavus]|uniref:ComEA family DNA-binding protein n=1 Tax=Agaribacter flavus TaxID=1902781 RepID=A0ABV7FRR8_9ALTE
MKLTTWITVLLLAVSALIYSQQDALADSEVKTEQHQIALVNINTAEVSVLSSLPGIGQKKAQAIVDYRKLNGKFRSKEELVNVKGIGEKLLEKVITYIEV